MLNMRRLVLAFCAFVYCSITGVQAQDGSNSVRLVVNGEGPTKTEATKQALRSAIEQTFGTFVSANTSILNDDIVRDEIATLSSGNVESFKEISSTRYPDGTTSVTLEAVVSIGKLVSYSKAHGSSAEFSGSTLMYNQRLRRLNKENEAKALMNILIKLDKIYTTFWDYRIEIGEATEGYAETRTLEPRYQYSSIDKGQSSSWKQLSGRRSGWILPFSIHVSPTYNFTAFIFELKEELKAISGQNKSAIPNSGTLISLPDLRNDRMFVNGFAESLVHYLDPMACFEVVLQGQSEHRYTLKSLRDFTDTQKRVFHIPYLDSETLILDGDSYSTTQKKSSLFYFSYESLYGIVWNGEKNKTLECRLFFPGESIESVTGLSVVPLKETVIDHKGAFLERYTGVQDNLQIMPFDAVKELDLSEIGVPQTWPDWSQKNGEVIIDCNANRIFIVPDGRCMRFETDKSPDQLWKKDGDVQELDFKSPDCYPLWLRYAPGKRAVMEVAMEKRYRMASRSADNEEDAIRYRKSAEQGNAFAQNKLGDCYYFGRGVIKDYGEAVKWFRASAEQGYADAQYNLGIAYFFGHGVMQDYGEAVKWFRASAEQGFASGQYNLGVCYYLGKGVTKDVEEAVKWLKKSATQGDKDAINVLEKIRKGNHQKKEND